MFTISYTPTSWTDRAVQYAKRYFLRDNGGSDKNLLPPFNEGWTLHENTRMKQGNYVGKVSGSTTANANISKYANAGQGASLLAPSSGSLSELSDAQYSPITTLNGTSFSFSRSTNLDIAQQLFSFDLIEHVLRNYGSSVFGVAVTTPERVAWLKLNVAKFVVNWHGYGSSPSGNKAYLGLWNTSSSLYDGTLNHTNGTVTKITQNSTSMSLRIDTNGFVHFLTYADASNGTTASTINTDFVELEVYMAAGSIPQADYTLTLNATATGQQSSIIIAVASSTTYTASWAALGSRWAVNYYSDAAGTVGAGGIAWQTALSATFTTPSNAVSIKFYFDNNTTISSLTFTNPQLELGSTATTFAPMKTYDVTQAPGIVTQAGTPLNAANLNIIEAGVAAAHAAGFATDTLIGNRTITDSTAQTGGAAATLTTLLGQIGNMIKGITGKSNWYTSPVTSIESLNTNKAPLASPGLTGTPTAPTASAGTNTTQLATTAFVTTADNLKANIASPALTGVPTAPTAAVGTNTTQIATTEFVTTAGSLVLITNTYSAIDTSAISFTSIPGTYKDLILLVHGVSTTTGSNLVGVSVTVNDVTTGYGYSYAYWDSTGSPTASGTTGSYYLATPAFAGKLTSSDSRGFIELMIPNYTVSSGVKTMYSKFSTAIAGGSASNYHGQSAGATSNVTGAITKITVTMNTGSFAGGVQMTLYGRK